MDYFIVLYKTLLFYIIITSIYRFMGKREIGQLSIVDLIVSILIAELAAISIDNRDESIFLSILPIVLLVGIQVLLSFLSLKSSKIRNIFDGNPSVIIYEGKINFSEMIRYNLDDLLTQLREKQIRSIEEVEYAVLENNGKLSVFTKESKTNGQYPFPVILDGYIEKNTLKKIGKDKKWLYKMLEKENVIVDDIFYAFYRNEKLYIIKNTKEKD